MAEFERPSDEFTRIPLDSPTAVAVCSSTKVIANETQSSPLIVRLEDDSSYCESAKVAQKDEKPVGHLEVDTSRNSSLALRIEPIENERLRSDSADLNPEAMSPHEVKVFFIRCNSKKRRVFKNPTIAEVCQGYRDCFLDGSDTTPLSLLINDPGDPLTFFELEADDEIWHGCSIKEDGAPVEPTPTVLVEARMGRAKGSLAVPLTSRVTKEDVLLYLQQSKLFGGVLEGHNARVQLSVDTQGAGNVEQVLFTTDGILDVERLPKRGGSIRVLKCALLPEERLLNQWQWSHTSAVLMLVPNVESLNVVHKSVPNLLSGDLAFDAIHHVMRDIEYKITVYGTLSSKTTTSAIRRAFLASVLEGCAATLRGDLRLVPGYDLRGDLGVGTADFVATFRGIPCVCVSECGPAPDGLTSGNNTMADAVASNIVQMYTVAQMNQRFGDTSEAGATTPRTLYGIVSSGEQWLFLSYTDGSRRLHSNSTSAYAQSNSGIDVHRVGGLLPLTVAPNVFTSSLAAAANKRTKDKDGRDKEKLLQTPEMKPVRELRRIFAMIQWIFSQQIYEMTKAPVLGEQSEE